MKKYLSFWLLFLVFTESNAQKNKKNLFQEENSTKTESKIILAKMKLDSAYVSYDNLFVEKSKYFLDQSKKLGIKSGDFYFLLGAYMFRKYEFRAAKRYWKIAYTEGDCWECKELLSKLENKESIEVDIIKKVRTYLAK